MREERGRRARETSEGDGRVKIERDEPVNTSELSLRETSERDEREKRASETSELRFRETSETDEPYKSESEERGR